MDKQTVAKQMIDHYKWCVFHDIEIFGDFVRCLGYQCRKELVALTVNDGCMSRLVADMREIGK